MEDSSKFFLSPTYVLFPKPPWDDDVTTYQGVLDARRTLGRGPSFETAKKCQPRDEPRVKAALLSFMERAYLREWTELDRALQAVDQIDGKPLQRKIAVSDGLKLLLREYQDTVNLMHRTCHEFGAMQETPWRFSSEGKAMAYVLSQIAHALDASLYAEGSTTATKHEDREEAIPLGGTSLDLFVALAVIRRADFVVICNSTKLPVFVLELKDPVTLGLLLKSIDTGLSLTEVVKRALRVLGKDPEDQQGELVSEDEAGSLVQTVVYMMSMACPVACLTDGLTYVFLCLRRRLTQHGASEEATSTNVFDLLTEDAWYLFYYVCGHCDMGATPQRCMAACILQARIIQAQWVHKQRPFTRQRLAARFGVKRARSQSTPEAGKLMDKEFEGELRAHTAHYIVRGVFHFDAHRILKMAIITDAPANESLLKEDEVYKRGNDHHLLGTVMPNLLDRGHFEQSVNLLVLEELHETHDMNPSPELYEQLVWDAYCRLWAAGILHNDVQPRHIRWRRAEDSLQAVIIDFGASSLAEAGQAVDSTEEQRHVKDRLFATYEHMPASL